MYTIDHKREYAFLMAMTVLLITLGLGVRLTRKEPDAVVVVAAVKDLSHQQLVEVQAALEQYLPDLNQDGEVLLKLQYIQIKAREENQTFTDVLRSDKNVLFVTDTDAFKRLKKKESLVILQDVFTNVPGVEGERFYVEKLPTTEWKVPIPEDLTVSMRAFNSLKERENEETSDYYQGQCYFMDNIVSNRKVM